MCGLLTVVGEAACSVPDTLSSSPPRPHPSRKLGRGGAKRGGALHQASLLLAGFLKLTLSYLVGLE